MKFGQSPLWEKISAGQSFCVKVTSGPMAKPRLRNDTVWARVTGLTKDWREEVTFEADVRALKNYGMWLFAMSGEPFVFTLCKYEVLTPETTMIEEISEDEYKAQIEKRDRYLAMMTELMNEEHPYYKLKKELGGLIHMVSWWEDIRYNPSQKYTHPDMVKELYASYGPNQVRIDVIRKKMLALFPEEFRV